jgi:hypothetical protein
MLGVIGMWCGYSSSGKFTTLEAHNLKSYLKKLDGFKSLLETPKDEFQTTFQLHHQPTNP